MHGSSMMTSVLSPVIDVDHENVAKALERRMADLRQRTAKR